MTAYHRIIPVLALAGCLASTGAMAQTGGNATERAGATTRQPDTRPAGTPSNNPSGAQSSGNIVTIASSEGQFSTLAAALKQADLVATLGNPGPFTVFAPDNEAFKALPAGTLDNLMKDNSKETLASILKFHVVPGRIRMTDLEDGQKLKTVNGEELSVTKLNGKVAVNGVELDQPDLEASNGIIHVVSKVLLPPKQGMVGNKKE
jgi:uncharacterized surface protein with fasciclin (FAS1) repeats